MSGGASDSGEAQPHLEAPWREDQEWLNALTHAFATAMSLACGAYLVWQAGQQSVGLAAACAAYAASVVGTFFFSTMSHLFQSQPMLNRMRAWDQAMIYLMIVGTYTPIAFRFATDDVRTPLIVAMWVGAAIGFLTKVAGRLRINSAGTISYLMLGWLPAVPLAGNVPSDVAWPMAMGGVVYSIGVLLLINDERVKYMHAAWHMSVMTAAFIHYWVILNRVVLL